MRRWGRKKYFYLLNDGTFHTHTRHPVCSSEGKTKRLANFHSALSALQARDGIGDDTLWLDGRTKFRVVSPFLFYHSVSILCRHVSSLNHTFEAKWEKMYAQNCVKLNDEMLAERWWSARERESRTRKSGTKACKLSKARSFNLLLNEYEGNGDSG